MKQHAAATDRNRGPILDVLRRVLPASGAVLEIASGTGQHAVFFAGQLPGITWQPSDVGPVALASIEAWRAEAALPNVLAPLTIDVTVPSWDARLAAAPDAIVCINMIHIAPWAACEGLVVGAARLLRPGGVLYLYGPFLFGGRFTAPSNEQFDATLRETSSAWGVRDIDEVAVLAHRAGLEREGIIDMPANNHSVIFRRTASG